MVACSSGAVILEGKLHKVVEHKKNKGPLITGSDGL